MATKQQQRKSIEIDWEALRGPFPKRALGAVVLKRTKDGQRALFAPHLTARAVAQRLDEVVGPEHWRVTYRQGPSGAGDYCCRLEIEIAEGQWVAREDGAAATEFEAVKGGYSEAFKRAAVVWGIGRYLYEVDALWLDADTPPERAVNAIWARFPSWARVEVDGEENGERGAVPEPPEEVEAPRNGYRGSRGAARASSGRSRRPEPPEEAEIPPNGYRGGGGAAPAPSGRSRRSEGAEIPWLAAFLARLERARLTVDDVVAYLRENEAGWQEGTDWRAVLRGWLTELSPNGDPGSEVARAKLIAAVRASLAAPR